MEGFGWIACRASGHPIPYRFSYLQLLPAGANYLTFDIIGDLAFGAPFGMIMAAKDSAPMAQDPSCRNEILRTGRSEACLEGN